LSAMVKGFTASGSVSVAPTVPPQALIALHGPSANAQ